VSGWKPELQLSLATTRGDERAVHTIEKIAH